MFGFIGCAFVFSCTLLLAFPVLAADGPEASMRRGYVDGR